MADSRNMRVGEELRKAREEAGLSQEQLAEQATVTRVYVSLLERNQRSPTLDVYFRLCHALGISPSKLMQRIERTN